MTATATEMARSYADNPTDAPLCPWDRVPLELIKGPKTQRAGLWCPVCGKVLDLLALIHEAGGRLQ